MSFDIKLVEDNTEQVSHALYIQSFRALNSVGAAAESNVKLLTPVDTGRLKSSIGYYVDTDKVIIGSNVEYARAVEFNDMAHHKNGQAHFLRDGINKNISVYKRIIEDCLKR